MSTQSNGSESGDQKTGMKRTLTLTSLTVNAMALIAPGAFLWTTFQIQAAQVNGSISTASEMWTGLVAALILVFLTAISYAELANIYPKAGAGSSYYYAEAAFLEKEKASHRRWARIAKFLTGWISHLYYWIYPGIMVAFSATLVVYIFGLFGISLAVWAEILVAALFAAINGYIAYRGITGSTLTALAVNAIQLVALVVFSVLAILYRHFHPGLYYANSISSILLPHNFTNVVFQSTIAILLLVGFESVTALGAEARHPKRDIRRAVLLALIIQGLFAYLFEYFAANYMVGSYSSAAASSAPIGDMARTIGNSMLGGTGLAFTVILAVTVMIALIGTTLACLNTAVRVTYAMGKDKEVPSLLGVLHGKFATPHWGIVALVLVSAIFGAYGVLNIDHLTQITLASNTGTFLLYGLTNLIALVAFFGRPGAQFLKHRLVPVLGFLANLVMLVGVVYLSFKAGGTTSRDTVIALVMVVVWLAAGAVWFVLNTRRQGYRVLVSEAVQLMPSEVNTTDPE
ncbi:MAG TPA: APC family permease [Dehalococcoidia bacterium]|nr:APC family permease [Dehalococcoidia bacterium]